MTLDKRPRYVCFSESLLHEPIFRQLEIHMLNYWMKDDEDISLFIHKNYECLGNIGMFVIYAFYNLDVSRCSFIKLRIGVLVPW